MIFAGLDIGSVSCEAVLLGKDKKVLSFDIARTGSNSKKAAEKCLQKALKKTNRSFNDITSLFSTGYGRKIVPYAAEEISEISCHAIGANYFFPDTRTVIDIGGQDSKAIRLNEKGEATDFNMNDKCAAGTGRFLEEMAKALDTNVDNLGKISLRSKKELVISSMCTVFAESEVVSLLAEGQARDDIARALHNAIADRVLSLAHKVRMTNAVTITGGVAKNIGVVEAIKAKVPNFNVNIPEEPQIIGALGAAIMAYELTPKGS